MEWNSLVNTGWVVTECHPDQRFLNTSVLPYKHHLCTNNHLYNNRLGAYNMYSNFHANYFEGRLAEFPGKSHSRYTSKMLISTHLSFSYLESFFTLNTHEQNICD